MNLTLMNLSGVKTCNVMQTCGEWCQQQHYHFMIEPLLYLPAVAAFILIAKPLVRLLMEKADNERTEKFWKQLYGNIDMAAIIILTGYFLYLIFWLPKLMG